MRWWYLLCVVSGAGFGCASNGDGPDFNNFHPLGHLDVALEVPGLIFGDGTLAYVRVSEGFEVIDLNDGITMSIRGGYGKQTGGQGQTLTKQGPFLYYLDGARQTHVFSLADPANPAELGTVPQAPGLEFSGTVNYAPNGDTIEIADYADPLHPQPLGTMSIPGLTSQRVVADHLYVTATGGLSTYGLADPAHPALLSTVPLPANAFISYAFPSGYVWAGTPGGVQTIDVDPPESAKLVGSPRPPLAGITGAATEVSPGGRYWILESPDPTSGLPVRAIWDLEDPSAPANRSSEVLDLGDPGVLQYDGRFLYITISEGVYVNGP
ncbi:MAG: hypothetical protein NT062_09020 [Proteobacteria bacterium]|nr:hypothetical protein [Pseudomonadota bacterium]